MPVPASASLERDPAPGDRSVVDRRGRPLRDLRLSVTDRCDFRCTYCMPESRYTWLPREDILTFEELERVVRAFAGAGVTKVRLTGGEPLLRRGLPDLVARVASVPGIDQVCLTTNGGLLATHAAALRAAGLDRVTVSLDTLDPPRHAAITGRDTHAAVLAGIRALGDAGFTGTKLNAVVQRGVNDDEVGALVRFGAALGAEVRFIEYMDVGGATSWSAAGVVPAAELLERLTAELGPASPAATSPSAPARRYALADGTTFGVIASTTEPFCSTCDRSRVTADGLWYRCLYATDGTDLRAVLRGDDADALPAVIETGWRGRDDQGAVDRTTVADRGTAVPVELLRRDPHLEMHTRGG